ncbi:MULTISPECIES: DUF1643 domain-containing protein [Arthrobacter]|uniref:DUF1643 domain-containing protein n=2 Tax=Arthrobacter TaxID=1663 RepID=A0ABU9KNQ3_9MICC|nr:DUF1643 domain-containing protein [Arthrobacter sp. YJM1]MDP5228550.1 DUF1643 domain-containing protein [Arthrobacter sp. YJM1]
MTVSVGLGGRSVCALMLNPSFDEKASTSYAVLEVVAELKGWSGVEVANLFPMRTRNSKALAATSVRRADILEARINIEAVLGRAAEVLFAWGVSRLPGEHGRLHREQVEWVVSRVAFYGHESVWVMGGETRHPSRWRQYVGPQRALISGGSTVERLDRALVRRPLRDLAEAMSVVQGGIDGDQGALRR